MQPLLTTDAKFRPEILRQKQLSGAIYGIVAGLVFALSTWGWDGFLLSQAHAFLPWTKLIIGSIGCAIAGGLAGWLSARFDKGIITVILWMAAAVVFSWLNVALPLQMALLVSERLEPQLQGLIIPGSAEMLQVRFQLAFIWIVIFNVLAGVMEIPLVEPAVFSTSFFGKVMPYIICAIVLGIGGTFADNFNNEALRSPVLALDETIQFVLDHQGKQVDPAVARRKFAGSIRGVRDYLTSDRRLIINRFDDQLGEIGIIVKFEDEWIDCEIIYSQPAYCKILTKDNP